MAKILWSFRHELYVTKKLEFTTLYYKPLVFIIKKDSNIEIFWKLFFQRKKARKILPLTFLHKSFINNVKKKMQFRKELISCSNFEKNNIFLMCVLVLGENMAVFGKILVTSHPQKPFDNTFPLFFFAIMYTVWKLFFIVRNQDW